MSSLWSRILGSEGSQSDPFPWKPLQDRGQLDAILKADPSATQVIFKHSTRCGVSSMMLRRFERNWVSYGSKADFYLLDLISRRDLSDLVSQRLELRHESPQVLLLKGNQIVESASHGGISALTPDGL